MRCLVLAKHGQFTPWDFGGCFLRFLLSMFSLGGKMKMKFECKPKIWKPNKFEKCSKKQPFPGAPHAAFKSAMFVSHDVQSALVISTSVTIAERKFQGPFSQPLKLGIPSPWGSNWTQFSSNASHETGRLHITGGGWVISHLRMRNDFENQVHSNCPTTQWQKFAFPKTLSGLIRSPKTTSAISHVPSNTSPVDESCSCSSNSNCPSSMGRLLNIPRNQSNPLKKGPKEILQNSNMMQHDPQLSSKNRYTSRSPTGRGKVSRCRTAAYLEVRRNAPGASVLHSRFQTFGAKRLTLGRCSDMFVWYINVTHVWHKRCHNCVICHCARQLTTEVSLLWCTPMLRLSVKKNQGANVA